MTPGGTQPYKTLIFEFFLPEMLDDTCVVFGDKVLPPPGNVALSPLSECASATLAISSLSASRCSPHLVLVSSPGLKTPRNSGDTPSIAFARPQG